MNSVYPLFKPLVDLFHYATEDNNFKELTQFRSGTSGGNDWHSKFLRNEADHQREKYTNLARRFEEDPYLSDVLYDNRYRLTVLAGIERLITIRQAQPTLKIRFSLHQNNRAVFSYMMQDGFVKGYFKGYSLHVFQFLLSSYNTLLWAKGSNLPEHIFISSFFETMTYPIDTIKTIFQADLQGKYSSLTNTLQKVTHTEGLKKLFSGVQNKLIYNSIFIWNLRNIYEGNNNTYLSYPAWVASYAFLTLKTQAQVADTALTFSTVKNQEQLSLLNRLRVLKIKNLYQGVLPHTVLNTLFMYTFYAVFSEKAQQRAYEALDESSEALTNPAKEKKWS